MTGPFGSLSDVHNGHGYYGGYKLADATINEIIGDGTFDVLGDQIGYNTSYSRGNHEYAIIRNYTAVFRFDVTMPESTTTTVFESRRAADNALAWSGRLGCGTSGGASAAGAGINCNNVVDGPNPQGGAGCDINMGTSSADSWHYFYMSHSNSDTYLYFCNGAQHTSSHTFMHRFFVR